MPAAFVALAENGLVDLRWQTASAPGLLGYKLFRSFDPAIGFVAISDLLPPKTGEFFDRGLMNGTDHYYRLYFFFDRGLGPRFASDVATPGLVTPWVTDDAPSAPDFYGQVTSSGYNLSTMKNSWEEAVILRRELERCWRRALKSWKAPAPKGISP